MKEKEQQLSSATNVNGMRNGQPVQSDVMTNVQTPF